MFIHLADNFESNCNACILGMFWCSLLVFVNKDGKEEQTFDQFGSAKVLGKKTIFACF